MKGEHPALFVQLLLRPCKSTGLPPPGAVVFPAPFLAAAASMRRLCALLTLTGSCWPRMVTYARAFLASAVGTHVVELDRFDQQDGNFRWNNTSFGAVAYLIRMEQHKLWTQHKISPVRIVWNEARIYSR